MKIKNILGKVKTRRTKTSSLPLNPLKGTFVTNVERMIFGSLAPFWGLGVKRMKSSTIAFLFTIVLIVSSCTSNQDKGSANKNARIKALIVNGQMNASHDDKESTPILKNILEVTGIFNVEVATTPAKGGDMTTFKPQFSDYDVVVIDYDGDEWPDETKTGFVDYVQKGGGVVIVHSSDNAFPNWPEYNEMIGLGGWNGRNENAGSYVYWEKGEIVRNDTVGSAGHHGEQVPVVVETRDLEHPIMKGLPTSWMHAPDELYGNLRGPGKNMDILATAFSNTKTGGTGKNEPVLITISYGEGRIFHTVLGHINGNGPHEQMQCAGFITTLQRGAEWAATGEVLQEVPVEFPNFTGYTIWKNYKPLSLEELVSEIKKYKLGESEENLTALSLRIRKSDQKPETLAKYENVMIEILESNATDDAKNYICRELGLWGTEKCVPALEKLKSDKNCGEMAQFALTQMGK
jgi:type 1 glutamine amidotransferase